mmetsp:Transcript_111449/g.249095  ORF Transcript_111449/g.249095 Transcript_111449/m.249095 type:complete len:286 (+) Transcript_111449:62-919(+)
MSILLCFCILGCVCSACALKSHRRQSPQVDSSLQGALPIEWVHVPKAGSSFLNTLIHIPGVCPALPTDLYVSQETMGFHCMPYFEAHYVPFISCNTSAWDPHRLGHPGIEKLPPGGFEAGKGHFMMMFRQPEQRFLSSYYYKDEKEEHMDLEVLKLENSGCYTKMLTRNSTGCKGSPPTRAEVEEAKFRLQTGFSFVGITDQWDLSICLFSFMFKQTCHSSQFLNTRPTKGDTSTDYDTSVLNGWRDPYDSELFDIAMVTFEANCKKYNISESSCEPCWREAGLY